MLGKHPRQRPCSRIPFPPPGSAALRQIFRLSRGMVVTSSGIGQPQVILVPAHAIPTDGLG